jgi:cysteine desulfurase
MKEIYFDNAATTKPSKEVLLCLMQAVEENYANPSSMHDLGLKAELAMKKAAKKIAAILNCDFEELVFTAGGTEGNNLAIFGTMANTRKKHVITQISEHSSVRNCFKKLESDGYNITVLQVDENGLIDLNTLKESIREDTALVSLMHVNNETGAIQDIEAIGKIIKSANPKTVFHVDAVQSFGKQEINVKKAMIDLLSTSSHKIHGLKGGGALYISPKTRITPLFYGGGQQKNLRSGTENTFGILSFAVAAEEAYGHLKENYESAARINQYIREHLQNAVINSPVNGSPYILNLSFPGIRAEILLHALADKQIFVSAGSACSSRAKTHSILAAYGKADEIVESSIRLSFSHTNTLEEAAVFVETATEIIGRLKTK